jgi:hypothetical protein
MILTNFTKQLFQKQSTATLTFYVNLPDFGYNILRSSQ